VPGQGARFGFAIALEAGPLPVLVDRHVPRAAISALGDRDTHGGPPR
jgi:hypothetical protein